MTAKYKKDDNVSYDTRPAIITDGPILFGNFYIYDIKLPQEYNLMLFGVHEDELMLIQ